MSLAALAGQTNPRGEAQYGPDSDGILNDGVTRKQVGPTPPPGTGVTDINQQPGTVGTESDNPPPPDTPNPTITSTRGPSEFRSDLSRSPSAKPRQDSRTALKEGQSAGQVSNVPGTTSTSPNGTSSPYGSHGIPVFPLDPGSIPLQGGGNGWH